MTLLPKSTVLRYAPWPDEGGIEVQFRLIYRGELPSEGRGTRGRLKEKHAIRRYLRPQLAELWRAHPYLRGYMKPSIVGLNLQATGATMEELNKQLAVRDTVTGAQRMAAQFDSKGYHFLPLIGHVFDGLETACALDILFLRRDEPGRLITDGGDIDNRIKTLFDALKMPKLGEFDPVGPPEPDEDPFFCLIQDDSLINEIKITTDRLLTPLSEAQDENDVDLVIHVRTLLIKADHIDTVGSAAFST